MLLHHTTFARNLPSISATGLLTSYSQGKMPVIWFACRSKQAWAFLHVVSRHGGKIEDVVSITVDVPRRWLRRSKRGLWYSVRDVPVSRIRSVTTYQAISRSPVTEEELV